MTKLKKEAINKKREKEVKIIFVFIDKKNNFKYEFTK